MSYIGKEPSVGNFIKLDAITCSSTNTYNLQYGSAAFTPESVNHMLVSLNGVIQAPTTAYTVAGSQITFIPSSGTLSSSDTIDFIMVYGNVLDIGTPSDNTVSTAKIVADAVNGSKIADDAINSEHYTDGSIDTAHIADDQITAAKINNDIISGSTELSSEPADTDEFLVSDAGTLKRIDYSLIKGGGNWVKLAGGDNITADSNLSGYYTSDYLNYRWVFNGVSSSSASTLDLRLYKASSAISSSGYSYAVGMNYKSSSSHQWTTSVAGWGDDKFRLCSENVSSNGNLGATLIIDILDPQSAQKKNVGWLLWHERHDGAVFAKDFGDGILDDTDAHTGINIYSTSGNFGAQHWALYGMKV